MSLRVFSISSYVANGEPLQTSPILTEFELEIIENLVRNVLPAIALTTANAYAYIKALPKQLFEPAYRKQLSAQNRLSPIRRVLYACVIRQVIINEAKLLPTEDELRQMPFFAEPQYVPSSEEEITSLRRFYRVIQALVDIGVPGNNNKQTYIEVGAMLDGSNRSYAFGGAPSKATLRRQVIFHMVTREPMRDAPRARKRNRAEFLQSQQHLDAESDVMWQDDIMQHLLAWNDEQQPTTPETMSECETERVVDIDTNGDDCI
jgi:hypothetical protein